MFTRSIWVFIDKRNQSVIFKLVMGKGQLTENLMLESIAF